LLAGLVLLAALSLLALAASGSMLRQQHMAGNYADGQLARRAAYVAIFRGRQFLFKIEDEARTRSCLQDCFVSPFDTLIRRASQLPTNPEFEDAAWWRTWALPFGADPGGDWGSTESWNFGPEPPRFLIEELRFDDLASKQQTTDTPEPDGIGYYRILARGVGHAPFSVAVDEAIVARPWFGPDAGDPRNSPEDAFCEAVGAKYDCGLMALRQLR